MFFLFWQQGSVTPPPAEGDTSSAGGAGRKRRSRRNRSTPFFDLPPVTDKLLPTPKVVPKPLERKVRVLKTRPKPIELPRFVRKPEPGLSLITELLQGIKEPQLFAEFRVPPLKLKAPKVVPLFTALEPSFRKALLAPQNTPILKPVIKPRIKEAVSVEAASITDNNLILWIAAADGDQDAMLMLMMKE